MNSASQSVEEIVDMLNAMMVKENESEYVVHYDGDEWLYTHGFRRAFHYHRVYTNKRTGQVGFHVCGDAENGWMGTEEPNMGIYCNHKSMINGVAETYARRWKTC